MILSFQCVRGISRRPSFLSSCAIASMLLLAGCTTTASVNERTAQRDVASIGHALAVDGQRTSSGDRRTTPSLPTAPRAALGDELATLRSDSPESEFVRFAVYHHPAVRAAYYDWKASVAAIAPARALPDPQLTFQADIADVLMSLMPGLMFDIMAPGKRAAMAAEATATSSVAYRAYVGEVVRTAAAVRKAWVELAYAQDTHRLYQSTIHAAEQAVALASADYRTGRGMVNFEQQVRFQNLLAQHHSHHLGVAQQISAARARFKAALGLLPTDPDPAWPSASLAVSNLPSEEELWRRVQAKNPDLARMRAMVEMAVAGVAVARTGGTPDFTVGGMVDLKADPRMYRPTATMTLPVWREKIRANISAAEARRDAAAARVGAEQLNMAASLAQMLYMVREADSMLDYMNRSALPNLDRSLASAEASAQSGMGGSTMIAEVQLMSLEMRHDRLNTLRDRENAVVDLAAMINDVVPVQAPLTDEIP